MPTRSWRQLPQYHKDRPFEDPLLRCDGCNKVVTLSFLHRNGTCSHCGHKRVRNLLGLSAEEMEEAKEKDVDPDFLALFEEVPDE